MAAMLHGGLPPRRPVRVLVALVATLCGSASCSRTPQSVAARHFVLVTIDTLRADRVGVYSGVDLTPRLDRLAHEGAYAVNAMCHVPLTRPSHATILSGLLPWEAGVRDNLAPTELPSSPLLAEILKGAGFHTAAFVSSIVLQRRGGFGRGFDTYDDDFPKTQSAELLNTLQKPGAQTLNAALKWLETQQSADRIFLWLHLYEPHDPYEPPEPYASRYRDRPYDGEVAYVDSLIGELDDALERSGLRPRTLIAVASDHGEGLGEHQETLHGFFVYQTTLAVPIVLRGPGIARGGRIDRTVGLVDLVPTALDLLGVAVPQGFHPSGNSLAPTLRGGAPPPEAPQYAESLVPLLHFGWSDLRVLRRGSWKYVLAPRPELYDLSSDPHEQRNVAEEHPDRTAAFRRTLAAILDQERRSEGTRAAEALPVDLIERLGALGYVSGNDSTARRSPGADPKDKILEFRRANEGMRSGIVALNRRDFEAAARAFEALIGGGIESFEVHLYLARSYAGMKRAEPLRISSRPPGVRRCSKKRGRAGPRHAS
jgi:choline-sulfatase